jgi:hypothetical protein
MKPTLSWPQVYDGIAMDPQQLGHSLACLSVPAGQQIQHLEPWFFAAITFALQALLEDLHIFNNDRQGFAHRLFS